jgi:hypothetical protein
MASWGTVGWLSPVSVSCKGRSLHDVLCLLHSVYFEFIIDIVLRLLAHSVVLRLVAHSLRTSLFYSSCVFGVGCGGVGGVIPYMENRDISTCCSRGRSLHG